MQTLTIWQRLVITMRVHVGYSSAILEEPQWRELCQQQFYYGYGNYHSTFAAARSHFKAPWNHVEKHWSDQIILGGD